MRKVMAGIIVTIGLSLIGAIIWIVVLPRLDWGAGQQPLAIETAIAHNILGRWVRRNAESRANPLAPTPENLKAAYTEYQAHCAVCHGLDGSGRNQLEAEFYPPVAKLTGSVQQLSDAELYFIITKGISYTAMPSFGKTHSPDDLWHYVLWVRHLAHLSPAEQQQIEQQVKAATSRHEMTMQHGINADAP